MNHLGGSIQNRPCNSGRPIRIRPCNSGRPIGIRPCNSGSPNTDPSMQFRWGHTEFLFCKMLGKNLDESVRPLSHSQTSPGKSSCQDAFGKSLAERPNQPTNNQPNNQNRFSQSLALSASTCVRRGKNCGWRRDFT